jgi:hypothetical protein
MTCILISTSARNTPVDQPSGELVVYELETRKVIRRCEIIKPPYANVDPNPRGGLRGLKGISFQGDMVAIANASTIFLYDADWNPIRYFWHPSCALIHDIAFHQDTLWVTSAENDLVVGFSFSGAVKEIINARDFVNKIGSPNWETKKRLTQEQLMEGVIDFRNPATHNNAYSDSAHVNGIAFRSNGEMLVSYGLIKSHRHMNLVNLKKKLTRIGVWQKIIVLNDALQKRMRGAKEVNSEKLVVHPTPGSSAVLRIDENRSAELSLLIEKLTFPSHTVTVLEDGSATYLVSTCGELVHFDPASGEIFGTFRMGKRFLRGTTQLPDGSLLLGDHTNLLHFDLKEEKVISSTPITDNPLYFVFTIQILPRHFSLPPVSFNELHAQKLPVSQT